VDRQRYVKRRDRLGHHPGASNATPTGVTFTPSAAFLPDNAAAGTTVAAVAVSMSDGSAFSGTLAASPAGTVTISGKNLVLARALTAADDGSHQWTVTAMQSGVTASGVIQVQVNAANPPPPPPGNQLTTDDGSTILTSDNGSTFLMVS
jgi:hypothetical protein